MSGRSNNIFIYLILLLIVAYSSACSSTNAQSPKTETKITADQPEASKTVYKEPKRVSKDVISSDRKTAEAKKK